MNDKDNSKPMNFWQILDKIKYFVLLALFIILVIILSKGYSIETKYFKIGKVPDTLFIEKEIKIPADTVYKERVVTKYIEIPKKEKSTRVKNSETEISVNNQPANINTGTNNGIVGNNNTVNNIGEQPIALLEPDKIKLIKLLSFELDKLPKGKLSKIEIFGTSGNKRSMELAEKIHAYLKSKGYNVSNSINSAMFLGNNLKGVRIRAVDEFVRIEVFIV